MICVNGHGLLLFQLYLEGITSRQMQDALLIDKYIMDKDIQQASASASFLSKRSLRIEDQVNVLRL